MSIKSYIRKAMELVLEARMGRVSCDEALDGLWELLVNIDYEVELLRKVRSAKHASE